MYCWHKETMFRSDEVASKETIRDFLCVRFIEKRDEEDLFVHTVDNCVIVLCQIRKGQRARDGCMTEQSSHIRFSLLCFHFVNWRKGGHQTGNLQSCLFGVFELNTFTNRSKTFIILERIEGSSTISQHQYAVVHTLVLAKNLNGVKFM